MLIVVIGLIVIAAVMYIVYKDGKTANGATANGGTSAEDLKVLMMADAYFNHFTSSNNISGTNIANAVAVAVGLDDNGKEPRALASESSGKLESRFKRFVKMDAPAGLLTGIFYRMVLIPSSLIDEVIDESPKSNDEIIKDLKKWTGCSSQEASVRLTEYYTINDHEPAVLPDWTPKIDDEDDSNNSETTAETEAEAVTDSAETVTDDAENNGGDTEENAEDSGESGDDTPEETDTTEEKEDTKAE